ncbi:hypothetical protein B0F90DRAFT_249066 [Multifurca ochricompacta]|uniref:Uncharacterized protein n=1 Tax=Multifurca ochricompacta TaxID=376703 RepID=A0AAD4M5B4_9AGAM|nr:hypothetical protein B0F90DRAFT_249066 [Multifurca ochricompacta]
MASTPAPSHRASLLAGLRTGGVRSASLTGVPHTAAPGASFNVPSRFSVATYNQQSVAEEDDQLADVLSQVDGSTNRFAQQQAHFTSGLMSGIPYPNTPVGNAQLQVHAQQQALQMQLVQLELMRMQQLQAGLLAQSRQQNGKPYISPATAGPTTQSFDLHQSTLNAQIRRPSQGELLRSQLGVQSDDQVPMTAALGGKFGSRATLPGLAEEDYITAPRANFPLSSTTATSGAISLGTSGLNNATSSVAPSKSDTAVSWRRGGNNNSVLSGNRAVSANPGITPSVRVSPPPLETRVSPPVTTEASPVRTRPQPLRFTAATSQPLPTVAIDDTDAEDNLTESSSKSGSHSSPSTPNSGSSFDRPPLSPREEATKKLYEGLGIGRPAPAASTVPATVPQRVLSQPVRQPRGPPSGADELGPRNFATRIRRKAIGGLGALMDARERRDVVEVY